ncbi:MAG: hypothetical protein PHS62_03320 [Patescibacteria group bacterium]|nr:hypothetical protein [Patescibacteria group bacterium]
MAKTTSTGVPPAPAPAPAPGAAPAAPLAPAGAQPAVAPTTAPLQATPPTIHNPVIMQVFPSWLPSGDVNIFTRILAGSKMGIKGATVQYIWQGESTPETTDKDGFTRHPLTISPLEPDDPANDKLTAFVSGIEESAAMNFRKPLTKSPEQKRKDLKNNCIAMWAILVISAIWVVFSIQVYRHGFGQPLMSLRRTQLTEQQKLLNETPGVKGSFLEVGKDEPVPFEERWQKPTLLGLLCLTICVLGYGILSLREEVADILKQSIQKVMNRWGYKTVVSDPILSQIMEYLGTIKIVRKEAPVNAATTTTPQTGTGATTDQALTTTSSTRIFKLSLLADLIAEILPRLLRKLFMA